MGLRFFNPLSMYQVRVEKFYKFEHQYDPQEPKSCNHNIVAGNLNSLGLQRHLFDSAGVSNFSVNWPYNENVVLRCPVPTRLQIYDT